MDFNWGVAFCVVILLLALWLVWRPRGQWQHGAPSSGTINVAVTATSPAVAVASPSGASAPGQAADTSAAAAPVAAAAPTPAAATAAAVAEYMTVNPGKMNLQKVFH